MSPEINKMLRFELKKLFGYRTICLLLLAIYIIFVMSFAASLNRNAAALRVPAKDIDGFFEEYQNDPEYVKSVIADRQQKQQDYYERTKNLSRAEAELIEPLALEDVFAKSDAYSDDDLILILEEALKYGGEYPGNIERVIREASLNVEEARSNGMSDGGYYIKSQSRIMNGYEQVKSRAFGIGFEYVRGWDTLFVSGTADLFLVITVIIIAVTVFTSERSSGFVGILRVSKNGRGKTGAAKLGAMLIYTVSALVIYLGTEALLINGALGFSSGLNFIQAISYFEYAPVALTMFEYLGIFVLIKLLGLLTLAAAVMLVSELLSSIELVYIISIGVFALGYLSGAVSENSILHYIGFPAVISVSRLFTKLRLFGLGSFPSSFISATVALYICALVILLTAVYALFVKGAAGEVKHIDVQRYFKSIVSKFGREKRASVKYRTDSLLAYEFKKRLITSKLVYVLVLLIAAEAVISAAAFRTSGTQNDILYAEYLEKVHGPETDEGDKFITEEGEFIIDSLWIEGYEQAYMSGEISLSEYREVLKNYFYASSHYFAWNKLNDQKQYVESKNASGVDAWFINTKGWTLYINNGANLLMIAFILLLSCAVFSEEYSSADGGVGFAPLLRSAKRGRKETFAAKCVTLALTVSAVSLIFLAVDLAAFAFNFGLTDLDAPLASIEVFENIRQNIIIGEYLALRCFTVLLASVIFSLIIAAVSELTRNTLVTLAISTGVLFLPGILENIGLSQAAYFDIRSCLDGNRLWLTSCGVNISDNSLLFGILVLVILAVISCILMVVSYKKFCK